MDDPILKKRFDFWRKNLIGDSMHPDYCTNEITIEFMSAMLNQKTCIYHDPINSEPNMIREMFVHEDKNDKDNKKSKRHALLFEDDEFSVTKFGSLKKLGVGGTLHDWMNEGSITFI